MSDSDNLAGSPILERLPTPPEEVGRFRAARLLLLLDETQKAKRSRSLDIERLGFYDYFAANPFLVFEGSGAPEVRLVLAGFDSRTLGYQSSFQRFATRRQRMRFDLAQLVALGLVRVSAPEGKVAFGLTEAGAAMSGNFLSLYAQAYRESARSVIEVLNRLSDQRLHRQAGEWLQSKGFLIDLFDVEPTDA